MTKIKMALATMAMALALFAGLGFAPPVNEVGATSHDVEASPACERAPCAFGKQVRTANEDSLRYILENRGDLTVMVKKRRNGSFIGVTIASFNPDNFARNNGRFSYIVLDN